MNIWIILSNALYSSYNETSKQEKDIKQVKEKHGFNLLFMNKNFFEIRLIRNKTKLFYKDCEILNLPDLVIFRTKATAIKMFLKINNIEYINPMESSQITSDKALTHVALSQIGINMPKTIISYSELTENNDFNKTKEILGENFILKANDGYGGENVHLIKDEKEFNDMAKKYEYNCIFQENITSSYGKDIRVIIIGKKHVMAIKRENEKDFRSNLHLGGTATLFECSEDLKHVAIKIANHLNLDICGIDFLIGENDEYYVAEVNSSPGLPMSILSLSYSLLIDLLVSGNSINKM